MKFKITLKQKATESKTFEVEADSADDLTPELVFGEALGDDDDHITVGSEVYASTPLATDDYTFDEISLGDRWIESIEEVEPQPPADLNPDLEHAVATIFAVHRWPLGVVIGSIMDVLGSQRTREANDAAEAIIRTTKKTHTITKKDTTA